MKGCIQLKQRNSLIDLTKFLLSFFVVSIHFPPLTGYANFFLVNFLARIADPLFFSISSFLFFSKSNYKNPKILFNYLKRLAILYGIWCLIYSPFIISDFKNANCLNVIDASIWITKRIIFTGGYGALWFLPALMLGVFLCFLMRKFLKPFWIIVVSLPFYLLTSLIVEYNTFSCNCIFVNVFSNLVNQIFGTRYNGITFAFLFCAIGLYLAEKEKASINIKDIAKLVFSFLLLFAEANFIRLKNCGTDYWAMLFLVPCTFYLLKLLKNQKVILSDGKIKKLIFLQKTSILVFTMHQMVGYLLGKYFEILNSLPLAFYLCILITTVFSASVIVIASEKITFLKKLY